ncbi:hypothetical protein AOLI_G00081510 [Acnodon oligacanthus]
MQWHTRNTTLSFVGINPTLASEGENVCLPHFTLPLLFFLTIPSPSPPAIPQNTSALGRVPEEEADAGSIGAEKRSSGPGRSNIAAEALLHTCLAREQNWLSFRWHAGKLSLQLLRKRCTTSML